MKKNIERLIIILSVSAFLALLCYLLFAAFDFTDRFPNGRKVGMYLVLFVFMTGWNGVLFLIYLVTEQKSLEIKKPLADE